MIRNKPLKQGLITLAVLVPIYLLDHIVEQQVSMKVVDKIHGCMLNAEITSDKSGINSVSIKDDANNKIGFATYDRNIINRLRNEIGSCYDFAFYRHSFLIPNVGRRWIIGYELN